MIQGANMSIKQQIQDFIKKNPDTALEELKKSLPEVKESTLKSYFYKLKGKITDSGTEEKTSPEKPPTAERQSPRQQVLKFLNENLDTTVGKLQEVFPDINRGTIRGYFYRWKRQGEPAPKAKTAKKSVEKKGKTIEKASAAGSDNELVESLKATIASQKETIEAMKKTIELLSGNEDTEEHKDLKGMSLKEIKRVAATYVRGLKELPAKIRGN